MSDYPTIMGMNGAEIYQRMHANPSGTQKMEVAEDSSKFIAEGYREIMDDLNSAQTDLTTFWHGESAEAASGALKPLSDSALEYMGNLDLATMSLSSVAFGFNTTRADLREMSPTRPTNADGIYDTVSWWSTDAEESAAAWDEANRHNIQQYKSYQQYRQYAEKSLVRDYKPVEQMLTGGEAPVSRPDVPGGPDNVDIPDAGGSYGGVPGPAYGGYSPPTGSGPATVGSSQPATMSASAVPPSSGVQPPSDVQSPPGMQSPGSQPPGSQWWESSQWESSWDDGDTSLAGYSPSAGGFDPRGGGFGPSGSYSPSSYSSGSYSGGSYSGGSYSGGSYAGGAYGGFAPRGGSAAPGGTPTGGGRTTGTAPYSSGSAASRAYTATTSSSSSSTMGRAPFMGGAGAGGQGSEDEEHERKFTLPTDDPNTLFGGIPEGTTVVPPVIGE